MEVVKKLRKDMVESIKNGEIQFLIPEHGKRKGSKIYLIPLPSHFGYTPAFILRPKIKQPCHRKDR